MKNVFEFAEACLYSPSIDEKRQIIYQLRAVEKRDLLCFVTSDSPLPISQVTFPDELEMLTPHQMPKRSFATKEGIIAFFHAIAHIEFMAIYLAWDIIYRFRGLPKQFYLDWLKVAEDETIHFTMLRDHLNKLNSDYGQLPVHAGLWKVAEDSSHDLLTRLVLVPCHMEARGLDVTPGMINKFTEKKDSEGVAILSKILQDEIEHVKTGVYWLDYLCRQQSIQREDAYKEVISKHFTAGFRGPINRALRAKAGFKEAEINWLENGR